MNMKNLVSMVSFLLLCICLDAQSYGGEIKLKITYEGRPLVGYTITGSINNIDIGGKGVTDRHGNVTLYSDPLPIPNIDVKGVSTCGNSKREWEASGFVAIYASANNYYHLQLDRVVKQMSEMSGMGLDLIMASFGLDCNGALGSKEDGAVPHPKAGQAASSSSSASSSGSDPRGSSSSSSDPRGSSLNSGDPRGSNANSTDQRGTSSSAPLTLGSDDDEWDRKMAERKAERDKENAEWEAKNEARREQQRKETEQFHADIHSGKAAEEGFQNRRNLLLKQIDLLNRKTQKNKEDLADPDLKDNKRFDLEYDNEEMRVELAIKQLDLQKTNEEIANGNALLKKDRRQEYKEQEQVLKDELDAIKDRRKAGLPLSGQSGSPAAPAAPSKVPAPSKEAVDAPSAPSNATAAPAPAAPEELSINGTPISKMSDRDLKLERLSLRRKMAGLKMKDKTKGNSLSEDKKAELDAEIAETQALIDAIQKALGEE